MIHKLKEMGLLVPRIPYSCLTVMFIKFHMVMSYVLRVVSLIYSSVVESRMEKRLRV